MTLLDLSSGPIDSELIAVVNFEVFDHASADLAAIWLKGQTAAEPHYVSGKDIDVLAAWAATTPSGFLMTMPFLFSKEVIEKVAIGKDAEIKIIGDSRPFYVIGEGAIAAIDAWMAGAVTTLHTIADPALAS